MAFPYNDLRAFMDACEKKGELVRIKKEVDWNLELGGIARSVMRKGGPALLFENIKGYENARCQRLFINGLGNRQRVAMALGLPLEASYRDITVTMKERLLRPVAPVEVPSGPVKEVILRGDEIDLYEFPVPKYNHMDGGRYINTYCGVATMNPETKVMNVGTYRGMILEKNKIGVLLATTQHWGHHFVKYREMGREMPVAVVYGWDPTLLMVAGAPIVHHGRSEYDYCGALRECPVELVKCETSDIMVPAAAEIVVEGFINPDPGTYEMEGCFGEYPGTYGGLKSLKPVLRVECITHRKNPIFRGGLVGNTPGRLSEDGYWISPAVCAVIWNHLDDVGVPNVLGVWGSPVAVANNVRVQIKKIYRGHAQQVAMALWSNSISNYSSKNVVVVDEDIDVFSDDAVEWAISYRTNAEMHDIQFFHNTFGSMLDPSTPLPLRNVQKYGQGKTSRVLIDATVSWELEPEEQYGGKRFPDLCTVLSPEIEEVINRRWEDYGIGDEWRP